MKEKISNMLQSKFDCCKNKIFPYADLTMENGEEITVYAPSGWIHCDDGFSILTDDEEILHFRDLESVSEWIVNIYYKKGIKITVEEQRAIAQIKI